MRKQKRPIAPEPAEALAQHIAASRKARGLSHRALAEKLGLTEGAIRHWENARRIPSSGIIPALAKALRVTQKSLRLAAPPESAPVKAARPVKGSKTKLPD